MDEILRKGQPKVNQRQLHPDHFKTTDFRLLSRGCGLGELRPKSLLNAPSKRLVRQAKTESSPPLRDESHITKQKAKPGNLEKKNNPRKQMQLPSHGVMPPVPMMNPAKKGQNRTGGWGHALFRFFTAHIVDLLLVATALITSVCFFIVVFYRDGSESQGLVSLIIGHLQAMQLNVMLMVCLLYFSYGIYFTVFKLVVGFTIGGKLLQSTKVDSVSSSQA